MWLFDMLSCWFPAAAAGGLMEMDGWLRLLLAMLFLGAGLALGFWLHGAWYLLCVPGVILILVHMIDEIFGE